MYHTHTQKAMDASLSFFPIPVWYHLNLIKSREMVHRRLQTWFNVEGVAYDHHVYLTSLVQKWLDNVCVTRDSPPEGWIYEALPVVLVAVSSFLEIPRSAGKVIGPTTPHLSQSITSILPRKARIMSHDPEQPLHQHYTSSPQAAHSQPSDAEGPDLAKVLLRLPSLNSIFTLPSQPFSPEPSF